MKKTNVYLILSLLATIILTSVLGISLKKYYKKYAPPFEALAKPAFETIKNSSTQSLSYATVENENGSFTVMTNGDTLLIDDMDSQFLDKQALSSFAKDLTLIKGTKKQDATENLEDYGIDNKTIISAYYIDNTSLTFRFGKQSGGKIVCYIDELKELFTFPEDYLIERGYTPKDFLQKEISPSLQDDDFIISATLSGKCRELPIMLEATEIGNGNDLNYSVNTPWQASISSHDALSCLGEIFSLKADDIISIDASADEMETYKLDEPYSVIDITTKWLSFSLKASEMDKDGFVYMMSDDSPCIYKINGKDLRWHNAQYNDIVTKIFPTPELSEISSFEIASENSHYVFEVKKGGDIYKISCRDKNLSEKDFTEYIEKICSISPTDFLSSELSEIPDIQVKINYTDKTKSEIDFISDGGTLYATLRGRICYKVPADSIDMILSETKNLLE